MLVNFTPTIHVSIRFMIYNFSSGNVDCKNMNVRVLGEGVILNKYFRKYDETALMVNFLFAYQTSLETKLLKSKIWHRQSTQIVTRD